MKRELLTEKLIGTFNTLSSNARFMPRPQSADNVPLPAEVRAAAEPFIN
jgi:hypothetical protein